MKFMYKAYENMVNLLKQNCYAICNYENYNKYDKCAILRHDVDMSLEDALKLAKLEYKLGVTATYFILLSSDFYNIFSLKNRTIINNIEKMCNGKIGLHFDEVKYNVKCEADLQKYVQKEIKLMSQELEIEIKTVSMHRPSKFVLENDIKFDNAINSYSKEFFCNFKYLSDSRMHWSENIEDIIKSNKYKRLHILTHPFWYKDEEKEAREILLNFINKNEHQCYYQLRDNIRDLDDFIRENDIKLEY